MQRSLDEIKEQGLGLAAISYDSVEILKTFSDKHAITFPLLSDAGSKTIDAWGIRNREATGRSAGIPYPGTFVIDHAGAIVSRAFEDAYQERDTAASILAALQQSSMKPAGTTEIVGKYLKARLSQSDPIAAPGHRISLFVDVAPGTKIHVYAPGQQGYIPIELKVEPSLDFKAAPARLPASHEYIFAPLSEHVQVFDRPFRIAQDITLSLSPSLRQRASARETLAIAANLEYQACDDKVCFRPDSVPLKWTVELTPIER